MNDITTALANERDLTVKQREEMYKQYLLLGDQYAKEMGVYKKMMNVVEVLLNG